MEIQQDLPYIGVANGHVIPRTHGMRGHCAIEGDPEIINTLANQLNV
jgi:hypothetical protein